jgi:hypothetical protein
LLCMILGAPLLWIKTATKPALDRNLRTSLSSLVVAAGVQLPSNVVSNGFLTVAGILARPATSAAIRVCLLAVGGVLASAPLGQVHIAAIASQAGPDARPELTARKAVLMVSLAAGICALLAHPVLSVVESGKYSASSSAIASSVLCAPMLVCGYLSIAAALARRNGIDVASRCTAAAAIGLSIFVALGGRFGAQALAPALFAIGAISVISLKGIGWPTRESASIAMGLGFTALALTSLQIWPA